MAEVGEVAGFDFQTATRGINIDIASLAKVMRSLSTEQAALWQQVPYWALIARREKDLGYCYERRAERYETAYRKGLWLLEDIRPERRSLSGAVDLATGQLVVETRGILDPPHSLRDGAIAAIGARSLVSLSARAVLESLDPQPDYEPKPETVEELARWGVTEVYDRAHAMTAPAFEEERRELRRKEHADAEMVAWRDD